MGYLKQNGWHQRAYVYLLDEPNTRENYEQVLVLGQLVHEAVPGLRRVVVEQTYPHDPSWPGIDPAVDVWCPLWGFIDRDTIRAKLAGGDEVWSYTALVQRAPPYHPRYAEVKGKDLPHWRSIAGVLLAVLEGAASSGDELNDALDRTHGTLTFVERSIPRWQDVCGLFFPARTRGLAWLDAGRPAGRMGILPKEPAP